LKIEKNIERDRKKNEELEMQGWNVIVVWQCEVKTLKNRHQRLFTLVLEIMNNKMKTL
jgi:patch repair protein